MWLTSPENIVLSPSEIHVWRANLDINLSLQKKFWTTLSDDEKRRAERFRFSHLRVHYIASRGILRQLLSRYLSVSTQSLRFEYGEQGKPSLILRSSHPIFFQKMKRIHCLHKCQKTDHKFFSIAGHEKKLLLKQKVVDCLFLWTSLK